MISCAHRLLATLEITSPQKDVLNAFLPNGRPKYLIGQAPTKQPMTFANLLTSLTSKLIPKMTLFPKFIITHKAGDEAKTVENIHKHPKFSLLFLHKKWCIISKLQVKNVDPLPSNLNAPQNLLNHCFLNHMAQNIIH